MKGSKAILDEDEVHDVVNLFKEHFRDDHTDDISDDEHESETKKTEYMRHIFIICIPLCPTAREDGCKEKSKEDPYRPKDEGNDDDHEDRHNAKSGEEVLPNIAVLVTDHLGGEDGVGKADGPDHHQQGLLHHAQHQLVLLVCAMVGMGDQLG